MNIKNWFKNKFSAIVFAISKVEKNIFNQVGKDLTNATNQERRHLQGTLADSLVHGEITQEVKNLRWRTYKILQSSDKTSLEFDYIDQNGNVYYKKKSVDEKAILKKIKLDNYDDYELEMVINNNEITIGAHEAINRYFNEIDGVKSTLYFATNKGEKPINIIRNYTPKFFIENFTKKINIRKIDETKRLIEFYVSKYPDEYNKNSKLLIKELNKIIRSETSNFNFLDIDEIEFVTNKTIGATDFLRYSYKILNFDKIIEFDGNYVIKFVSEILTNGENILLEYIENELENKYKNKESKK